MPGRLSRTGPAYLCTEMVRPYHGYDRTMSAINDDRSARLWLREWVDAIRDAEEEQASLEFLQRRNMPRWFIDDFDVLWHHPVE